VLAGRYRLQRQLGAGAMGVVWLAFDERLQRLVAVKQLRASAVADPHGTEASKLRAMREGRIAARLRHPHVVTVYDVAEHAGLPLLVMEYIPSRSLATILAEDGRLEPSVAARIGEQAASALAAAHAVGIVHRDVKPGNLLVDEHGNARITDFGISHATGDVAVTQVGVLTGTPAYLAPETARGQEPSATSDVFSLGSTLYAAVEGVPPFGGSEDNALTVLHRVAAAQARPPQHAGPLTPVLAAMLRPDPDRRLTAAESGVALHGVAEGNPLAAGVWDRTAGETQALTADPVASVQEAPATARSVSNAGRTGTPAEQVPPSRAGGGTLLASPPPQRRPAPPARPPVPGQGRKTLLGIGAVVVVAAIGIVLAVLLPTSSGDGSHATAKTTPPRSATKKSAPPALSAATLTSAVSDYYALLPGHPSVAWAHLAPQMRGGGLGPYRAHWSTVKALSIVSPPQVVGRNTVSVNVQLTQADGSSVHETHHLGLIRQQSAVLINVDQLIGHTASSPPAPPTHKGNKPGRTVQPTKKHGNGHDQGHTNNGHGAKAHPPKGHDNNG
jgi:hypothetical protein